MRMRGFIIIALMLACFFCAAEGARIKDIVDIQGVQSNELTGTGLVIGLNGTGDDSLPSGQMLASLLRRNGGVTFTRDDLKSGNIAVVMVVAKLGPWAREGSRINIHVGAVNDATSLRGGMLLMTELMGADGEVYAVASSPSISTSSWTVAGKTGSKASKNHPTVGQIPGGAVVVREERSEFFESVGGRRYVTFNLHNGDFATAERIREVIESVYSNSTYVEDAGTVKVAIPDSILRGGESGFLAMITKLEVEVDMPAVVVINERTGTIVVGRNVSISETGVTQGSLVVKIKEQPVVSQPSAPFTDGATTAVTDSTSLEISEGEGHLIVVPKAVTVMELANALNAIGATPTDMIAIFIALADAGALQARIEMR